MMSRLDKSKLIEEAKDLFNPHAFKSVDKTIRLIAIFFAVVYIYQLINNWGLTALMLQDYARWDISTLEYFAPIVLVPIGVLGLLRTKRTGWIISSVFLSYIIISDLVSIIVTISWSNMFDNPSRQESLHVTWERHAMERAFGLKDVSFYIVQVLIYGTIFIYFNRRKVKELFQISKHTQWLVFGMIAILLALGIYVIK